MRRPRRRKSQLKEIGGEIGGVLAELGLEDARRAFAIGQHWEAAVGAEVAGHARPLALRGDVLEVAVESSVWAQQLKLQQPRILEALAGARAEVVGNAFLNQSDFEPARIVIEAPTAVESEDGEWVVMELGVVAE